MSVKIYVEAEETWDYFQNNLDKLCEEMVLVAENENTKYSVYITEHNGYPLFSVCKGEKPPEYEAEAVDEIDCINTAEILYVQYLYPVTVVDGHSVQLDEIYEDPEDTDDDIEEYLQQGFREDELTSTFYDFLSVALQNEFGSSGLFDDSILEDVLNNTLQYLTDVHGFSIYRPMYLTDENGDEVYSKFPYDEFDLSGGAAHATMPR